VAHGVPVVIGTSALPHAIADDFARWRPTVFPGVPAMWRALAGADVKLESLRLAISAGAPLAPEVARAFAERHGRNLHNFYGSSETGGIAFDRTGAATLVGGVGSAMRGVTLAGLPGKRLRVASAAVVTAGNRRRDGDLGYWVMPDRARFDSNGGVVLLGRRGRVVKIAGRRVNLEEVAMRLRRLAGVSEVWVGASEDGGVLGAAVRAELSAAEVRAALQVDTAAWKIPKRLVVLTAWPLTERGKVDAAALRARVFV
jgi:acyl-coenzyme A synthetase/AMP-(fatty) acid ligase